MNSRILLALITICSLCVGSLDAAYIYKNGTLINVDELAQFPIEEHYNLGLTAVKEKKWDEALRQFRIITVSFPDAALTKEAYYFLGVSYYHAGDYDLANKSLSNYLASVKNPKYFLEAFQHKLAIADGFRDGARKHLFGQEKLPRLFSDREEAVKIYDEIATALPTHEVAMLAMARKAQCLADDHQFESSIVTLQSLIRKFPKTEKACECYVTIASVLLQEAKLEQQNPDLLPLAAINLKKLENDFPKAEKEIATAKEIFLSMKEIYAQGLYDTGAFYERKSEPRAACLYYSQAITNFPETEVAKKCKERIKELDTYAKEFHNTNSVQ